MASLDARHLAGTARRILEEAAFIFAAPARRKPEWTGPLAEAELAFEGPETGILCLRTTPDFGAVVAANLMGIETDEPEATAQALPALGELLNMIAGAALAEVFGTRETCRLGIPRVRLVEAEPGSADAVYLLCDDVHPLELDARGDGREAEP